MTWESLFVKLVNEQLIMWKIGKLERCMLNVLIAEEIPKNSLI